MRLEAIDPVLPDGFAMWNAIVVVALLAVIALVVTTIVQIRRASHLDDTARAVWVLVVVVAPLLGAAAWYVVGAKPRTVAG